MPVTINQGAIIHYEDRGSGTTTLVWGHGFLLSSRFFDDLIARLPEWRSIAVDFRGHGRSAAATQHATLTQIADDIAAVMNAAGVRDAIYVGHSTGAAVGLRLAARHPGRVRAAVSLAGVPLAGMPDESRPLTASLVALQGNMEGMAAAFTQMCRHPSQEALIEAAGREAALVPPGPLAGIANTELYLDESEELLPGLTQPWLFVIPGDDVVIPPLQQLAGARRVPGARALWLNGQGHLMPQERPDEIAAIIRGFLQQVG